MNAFIIDDEYHVRQDLKDELDKFEVSVVGEAENADGARQELARMSVDVIFLDIRMPGEDGFALLESLDPVPYVIFVTAYNEYAIQTYDLKTHLRDRVITYLLKPVDPQRLGTALNTLQTKLSDNNSVVERKIFERLENIDILFQAVEYLIREIKNISYEPVLLECKKTSVKIGYGGHVSKQTSETELRFIEVKDIFLFAKEKGSNYIKGYDENCSEIQDEFRESLKKLNSRLPDRIFFQATRDMIINLKYLKEVKIQNEKLILHFNVNNLEDFLHKREGQNQANIFEGIKLSKDKTKEFRKLFSI